MCVSECFSLDVMEKFIGKSDEITLLRHYLDQCAVMRLVDLDPKVHLLEKAFSMSVSFPFLLDPLASHPMLFRSRHNGLQWG